MLSTSLLVLGLSALSTALPALVPKDTCSPKTSFSVVQFLEFKPAADNVHPHSISFFFSDNSIYAQCERDGPVNGTVKIPCDDTNLEALWDGTTLSLTETYTPCNS